MISVIVPVYNESQNKFLPQALSILLAHPQCEVICVDSKSHDGTAEILARYKAVKVVQTEKKSRAARINEGLLHAVHDMVLLHHPRSVLNPEALENLIEKADERCWGGFTHRFDHKHWLLDFTSWYSNKVRSRFKSVVYLDHCIFFHKSLLGENLSFPDVDIFEDTLISQCLARSGPPQILNAHSTTSSIRFRTNGIYTQCLMNAVMKAGFIMKVDPVLMNKIYEKGLSLNTIYTTKASASPKDH